MEITGNEPAMPIEYEDYNSVGLLSKRQEFGLTKREYFAALAMQSLASDPTLTSHKTPLEVAHIATVYADALIEELNKSEE